MKKWLQSLIVLTLLLDSIIAFCVDELPELKKVKTYSYTVNQQFAGSQSPDDAKIAAIAKGKTEVLEQAGTFLESVTVVENFALTKDQSIAIASGILSVDVLSQKNYATDQGFGIVLELKINVDTGVLDKRVRQIKEDMSLMEKYSELKDRENELVKRIKLLEKQNIELTRRPLYGERKKRKILEKQYEEVIDALPAIDLNQKAIALWEGHKYKDPDKAIEYLNESIRLDPNNPISYNNRGVAHYNMRNRQLALEDFNQALLLDSNYADAYKNRGVIFFELMQYNKAIEDFNQAIRINPQRVESFLNRAAAYKNIWQYQRCLDDLKQALLLDPNYADKSAGQASANIDLNELERLCENTRKACDLGLCNAKNYLDGRGFCK